MSNSRQDNLTDAPPPQLYVPQRQATWFFSTLLVRAGEGRPFPATALRTALERVDPNLPVEFRSLDSAIADTAVQSRFLARLFGALGGLALLLMLCGVYAGLAFSVAQRTREFGLRIAFGASPRQIVGQMGREVGLLLAAGLGVGGIGIIGLSGTLRSQLHGVAAHDPAAIAIVGAALAAAAFMAAAVPACRAAVVPPAIALRHT